MNEQSVLMGLLIDETTTISFQEVCLRYHIPEALLTEMIEEGLFPNQANSMALNVKALKRIESACRLHKDLGINLPGVALALDLLDELDTMRDELAILRKHF